VYPKILSDLRTGSLEQKRKALSYLTKLFSPDSSTSDKSFIGLARVSVNSATGVDRIHDFYSGKFSGYYCRAYDLDFGPQQDITVRDDLTSATDQISTDASSIGSWLSVYRML